MYPRTLAPDERITDSEVKVFDAIRDGLPDEWDAYHSVGWVARDHAEGSEEGEIDMVLVHPEEGVLCVEVKGYGIECIGGEWHRLHKGERGRDLNPRPPGYEPGFGVLTCPELSAIPLVHAG